MQTNHRINRVWDSALFILLLWLLYQNHTSCSFNTIWKQFFLSLANLDSRRFPWWCVSWLRLAIGMGTPISISDSHTCELTIYRGGNFRTRRILETNWYQFTCNFKSISVKAFFMRKYYLYVNTTVILPDDDGKMSNNAYNAWVAEWNGMI